MSRKDARVGDITNHGGIIITGSPDCRANNRKTARVGDLHMCPAHGIGIIITGSSTVRANNRKTARVGDMISCGAIIITGSPDVRRG